MTEREEKKPNGRGRPRVDPDDKTMSVTVQLFERQYAALCTKARRRGVTPSALIRQLLARLPS